MIYVFELNVVHVIGLLLKQLFGLEDGLILALNKVWPLLLWHLRLPISNFTDSALKDSHLLVLHPLLLSNFSLFVNFLLFKITFDFF